MDLNAADRRLLAALEPGLALVPQPYARLAAASGLRETEVRERLASLREQGVISRLGLVVRHRELGYRANAMVVIDVPDAEVDSVGAAIAAEASVSLCYRRRRQPPHWPYNLYLMLHGRDRATVESRIAALLGRHGLDRMPHSLLFSTRRFKQRGARYFTVSEAP